MEWMGRNPGHKAPVDSWNPNLIKQGQYIENGKLKKLRDKDKFDGEDLFFIDNEEDFGIPEEFNNKTYVVPLKDNP